MNPGLSESIIAHLSLEDFFAFEGFSFTPTVEERALRELQRRFHLMRRDACAGTQRIAERSVLWYDLDKAESAEVSLRWKTT